MNEFDPVAKFLVWAFSIFLASGGLWSAKKVTYKMAEMALDSQEHQMSWGKFSKQLWSTDRWVQKAGHR